MSLQRKAWVVSVNMGYGHDRAAYGLEELAYGDILSVNAYPGIPEKDVALWERSRHVYETVSRLQPLPLVGEALFGAMDYFQKIEPFYPRRDLSQPTAQLKEVYRMIRRDGLGKHFIEQCSRRALPMICTFFSAAYAAEEHEYPGDIYLVVCDADCSRAWAPLDPKQSRIKYLASNGRVVERLKLYGVREEKIFLTGFPLPKRLVGGVSGKIVKQDLSARLCNLDPEGVFLRKYHETLKTILGAQACKYKQKHPLTVTFCVGGAGAQRHLGIELMESLRSHLHAKRIRLNLEVGTRQGIAEEFLSAARDLHLQKAIGTSLNVHVYKERPEYFHGFMHTLRTTDILWTKPSELSFYCGLGLPIVMAPPIGSQEVFNRMWLETVGAGTMQFDPRYADEWLFDWVRSGGLARFAWNGYIEAPTHGTYRIENIVTGANTELEPLPLIV